MNKHGMSAQVVERSLDECAGVRTETRRQSTKKVSVALGVWGAMASRILKWIVRLSLQ